MYISSETAIWSIIAVLIGGWIYRRTERKILGLVEGSKDSMDLQKRIVPKLALQAIYLATAALILVSLAFYFHDSGSNTSNLHETMPTSQTNITEEYNSQPVPPPFMSIYTAKDINTTFEDVAGLATVKEEVKDIIYYLRNPINFTRLGAKPPKGMIIEGEPGTGKTLLARALAGESGVNFIATSGSSFEDTYIGVGASRIRELFKKARQMSPCIIFIDEIDAVAKDRKTLFMQNLTQTQTINQLLSEMDGLNPKENSGVFVIAATNRIEDLDKAILRPGRFDRKVHIGMPTRKERQEILDLYVDKIVANKEINTTTLARMTTGFSGADLADLVNEAAIYATKKNQDDVDLKSFEAAKEKIILGLENPSLIITDEELKMTAYHEAGHTLVGSVLMPNDESVYKVTIAPRGPSLGATHFIPEGSKQSYSKEFLLNKITMQLAGRAAEELIYGKNGVSTGASSDFKGATEIAYNMVTKWGFSDRVGTIYQEGNSELINKELVQEETQKILDTAYNNALNILRKERKALDNLATALVEHETIDGDKVKEIIALS